MNRFSLVSLTVAVLLNFVGCATTPAPIALDPVQLNKAATRILSEAIYYTSLFDTCIQLGGEQEVDTINTQQNWLEANWPLVAAADSINSEHLVESTFSYRNQLISPSAIKLQQEAQAKAISELALDKRSRNNQQKTCSFRLAKLTPENIQLANNPDLAPLAAEILQRQPNGERPIGKIPSLAGTLDTSIQEGRSYYALFKDLERECPNAHILVIANEWPLETYANFCGDQYLETIECEWGKCSAKKL